MIFDKIYLTRARYLVYALSAVAGAILVAVGYLSFGTDYSFHCYVGFALVLSLLAPSMIVHMASVRKSRLDDALPRLLDDISESYDAGMTLLQALEASSKRKYGPMTDELKKLAAQLSWGVEFEKAFKSFSDRISTDLSARITTLLIEAVMLGGDLKTTFKSTTKFLRQMIALKNERESQLRPFLMVIYASSLVFLLLIVILYNSFFVPMAAQPTRFLRMEMSLESYKSLLFDLALVEAIFGGLTAGKLSQGLTLIGVKHAVVLIFVASVTLTVLF